MDKQYDVLVVGGGPAGCYTAKEAAERGMRVLVVEKDREIGLPVRCAEGVGDAGLREFFEPDPRWVANEIDGFSFFAPDGTQVDLADREIGYVLERRIFDQEIGRLAAEAGARIVTRATAAGMTKEGVFHRVTIRHLGKEVGIEAKIVVGADGTESRVGRWAGLRTACSPHDLETGAQYTLAGLKINPRRCQLWFGHDIAPGGYLWVFPKGAGKANVGLGISGEFSRDRSPFDYLDRFVATHFPAASKLGAVAGAVPCSGGLKRMAADGVLLVGDAAHQVNPLSGGGIINALKAARIAGRVAAQAIAEGDVSQKRLAAYESEWMDLLGKSHRRFYRLKEGVFGLSDRTMNRTAQAVNQLEYEKRTLPRLFRLALFNHPGLLLEIPRLFFALQ
ncbi:MAG: NAD(P)/FAD-dependent oxidoreductase [Candidatus Latescibacterota bacterium]